MTDRRGIAAVTALLLLVLVSGVVFIMLARSLDDVRNSADDAGIVQTLLLARGTANLAGAYLQGPARAALQEIVEDESSTVSRWSFGTGDPDEDRPDPVSVARVLTRDANAVATQLQTAIDAQVCGAATPDVGDGRGMAVRIHVTDAACGQTLPGDVRLTEGRFVEGSPRDGSGFAADQTYALPYVIVAEGTSGEYRRSLVLEGEYRFVVGRGSFAQYALFTNVHRSPGGSEIWFTERTLFDGPVHTNERFRFYRTPWFGGEVTSAGCVAAGDASCRNVSGADQRAGAYFYGAGRDDFVAVGAMQPSAAAPVVDNRFGDHAPEFSGGVDWDATFVPLPDNSQDQEQAARDGGLFFGDDVSDLYLYAGDADGDVVADGGATFQYVEATTTVQGVEEVCGWRRIRGRWRFVCWEETVDVPATIRYRVGPATGLQEEVCADGSCTWQERGPFNGVIFADGDVERVRGPQRDPWSSDDADDAVPAIASFAQITLATSGDVRITADLAYEDPPCSSGPQRQGDGSVTPAECENLDAANILGIYSQGGDILIGNNNWDADFNAPENVVIHGVLMSSDGVVTVENFRSGFARGNVNLIGGIIEDEYGAFGTFNASTGSNATGYGRSITFDRRTAAGLAPPFFPTIGADGVKSVLVFSYGQREQLF